MLEDLVSYYLQMEHGYLFCSSSCKRTTPEIEYTLRDHKKKETIYVQVKQNAKIDQSTYDSYPGKVYLFSDKGYIGNSVTGNIVQIDKNKLFDFFKKTEACWSKISLMSIYYT